MSVSRQKEPIWCCAPKKRLKNLIIKGLKKMKINKFIKPFKAQEDIYMSPLTKISILF